jgi:hypothetical protein
MAQRGIGKQGRDRIKQSLNATSKDVSGSQGSREEAFDPWVAASPGFDNAVPNMLGERTNGMDSTRLSHAQYFFDPDTMQGNLYVKFRRAQSEYVYTGIPVYAARRIYDALSKGKTVPSIEQWGYYKHTGGEGEYFQKPEGTPMGKKFMSGVLTAQEQYKEEKDTPTRNTQVSEINPPQRNTAFEQLRLEWGQDND